MNQASGYFVISTEGEGIVEYSYTDKECANIASTWRSIGICIIHILVLDIFVSFLLLC